MRFSVLLALACVGLMIAVTNGQNESSGNNGAVAKKNGGGTKIANSGTDNAHKKAGNRKKKNKNGKKVAGGRKRNNKNKKNKNGRQQRLRKQLQNQAQNIPAQSTGLLGSLLGPSYSRGLLGGNNLSGIISSLVGPRGFFGQGSRMLSQLTQLYRAQNQVLVYWIHRLLLPCNKISHWLSRVNKVF